MIMHSFSLVYVMRNICRKGVNGVDYDHEKPEGYSGYSNLLGSRNSVNCIKTKLHAGLIDIYASG